MVPKRHLQKLFSFTGSSRSGRFELDLDHHFLQHELLQFDAAAVAQHVLDTGRWSLTSSDLSFDLAFIPMTGCR